LVVGREADAEHARLPLRLEVQSLVQLCQQTSDAPFSK
jgi:hypothetical protein